MVGLLFQGLPSSTQEPQLQEAPKLAAPADSSLIINEHGTGGIPPIDLVHLTGQRMPSQGVSAGDVSHPPASCDWCTQGKVTPVGDQGACGSCYAFASIANIESKLLNGHGTGFIPPPMDLSHLTGQRMPSEGVLAGSVSLPSASFDWRTQGKVTPVGDQGACGSCYAFASIANIESKLLIDGAGTYDFSENNAKECNWYETADINGGTSCSGGNYLLMANLFSKKGTVLESCDPYVDMDVACKGTCPYQKTLLDWRIICGNVVPNTNVLKTYIQNYGPVYTALYASFPGFGTYDGSYTLYYTGTETPDHAVLIVGWDDSLVHAGGSGGWMVKNSWGTDWGGTCGYGSEKGYFTIAYGSASIGMSSSFMYDWQDYDSSGGIMFYDEGGWSTNWGWNDTTAWGLCKFIPSSDTYVTSVEFWTNDVTTDIDVYIYDDFDGTNLSNLLAQKLNNSFGEAGYHSVALDSPLAVTSGDDIIAVVKFTNSSYTYPVVADNMGPNETGRTYIDRDGVGPWYDLGVGKGDDVAIRLRTSTPGAPSVTTNDATNITTNSATLNGTLDDLGTASTVDVSFEWGTTTAYGNETTPVTKTSTGTFSAALSALSPNTTYHFRAKAVGNATSYYGSDKSFTTLTAPEGATATASRAIAAPTLTPGGTTEITVTFTSLLTESKSFALDEDIPSGWTFTRGTGDASTFKESTHEWVWFSVGAGASKTVTYSLTAPADAEGVYSISGTVTASGVANTVGGDSTIAVSLDILAYYRAYSGDPNVVDTEDLLKAADDWASGVIPEGFTESITTEQLLQLADEWAAG